MPNSTSWAVSGVPSDQRRPSRSRNVYRRPSGAISHHSAREGTIVRSGHCSTRRSNSCMQTWMLGQAIADLGSGSFGRKLVAIRSVADGVPTHGAGGRQNPKARW